jgi:hypothetical protein
MQYLPCSPRTRDGRRRTEKPWCPVKPPELATGKTKRQYCMGSKQSWDLCYATRTFARAEPAHGFFDFFEQNSRFGITNYRGASARTALADRSDPSRFAPRGALRGLVCVCVCGGRHCLPITGNASVVGQYIVEVPRFRFHAPPAVVAKRARLFPEKNLGQRLVYRDVLDDVWTNSTSNRSEQSPALVLYVYYVNSQGRGKTSLRRTSMGKRPVPGFGKSRRVLFWSTANTWALLFRRRQGLPLN